MKCRVVPLRHLSLVSQAASTITHTHAQNWLAINNTKKHCIVIFGSCSPLTCFIAWKTHSRFFCRKKNLLSTWPRASQAILQIPSTIKTQGQHTSCMYLSYTMAFNQQQGFLLAINWRHHTDVMQKIFGSANPWANYGRVNCTVAHPNKILGGPYPVQRTVPPWMSSV